MTNEQIAELERLREAATKGLNWQEHAQFNESCKLHLPAILGHLEAVERERDQLRALADAACAGMRQLGEDLVACRAEVERLRGALEEAGDVIHACFCETEEIRGKVCHPSCTAINAALALTPASAGARLKAEALRDAAQRILNDPRRWPTVIANHIAHDLCAEADRLAAEAEKEAANG